MISKAAQFLKARLTLARPRFYASAAATTAAIRPVYLDSQSTTPLDRRVYDAFLPYIFEKFGNPHSRTHVYGWEAKDGVEAARLVIVF